MADHPDHGDDAADLEARWAAARLAHAATALSKLQHDLRNMLAPAMLAAERLQTSDVASIKRAGDVTFRGAERANAAISATMALLRAGLPRPNRNVVRLTLAWAEAAATLPTGVAVRNSIASDPFVEATPAHLTAALVAVLAAIVAAGAQQIDVAVETDPRRIAVVVFHDGAPLPPSEAIIDRAASPYLAIAQEYVLAIEGLLGTAGQTVRIELNAAPGGDALARAMRANIRLDETEDRAKPEQL